MLDDRNYMRRDYRAPGDDAKNGFGALIALIVANVIVFFLQNIMPGREIDGAFALTIEGGRNFELWRFVTAAFLHDGFGHIFFNMFGLYIFGMLAAPLLGAKRFVWLFLASAVTGNVLWFLLNLGNPYLSLVGASGGVMGVILAAAMMTPDIPMLILFIPFPVKLKTLAIVYIVLEIFSQIASYSGPVAYLAHIGGFLGGYLFMRFFAKERIVWDPAGIFRAKTASISGQPSRKGGPTLPPGWTVTSSTYDPRKAAPVPREEVDRLLDKLSRVGINGLTEAEQETLRRAREEMMKR